ncbi:exported hypothetical protein [Vibrio nigripulchritudo SFn118]|nr:exported hypothetical protein [Vibrio nigripulchritudo SFn118]
MRWSFVWFLVTVTLSLAHVSAMLATACNAGKSLERMLTLPDSTPQLAYTLLALVMATVAAARNAH